MKLKEWLIHKLGGRTDKERSLRMVGFCLNPKEVMFLNDLRITNIGKTKIFIGENSYEVILPDSWIMQRGNMSIRGFRIKRYKKCI